ncbi:MAG: hypothetical protein V4590_10790 [Bacteroidota bacterium]
MKRLLIPALVACTMQTFAQMGPTRELKMNLNEDGSHYLKATLTGQVWLHYNESNPGTTVNGYAQPETYDIGLRRVRSQFFGKISDKVFLYTQLGINNFGYNSSRKPGIFFHDVVTEYYVTPRALQIGAGLTAWTGFARYASPAVASILAYDAPLYQQSTNDVNDQFLRKFSVYAKGKLGKLDYRLVLSDPMLIDATTTTVKPLNVNSDFAYTPPKLQTSGYMMFQFWDQESNLTPYIAGTYLGKKRVLNIGAGFQYQPDAMWHLADTITKSIVKEDLLCYALDLFYDNPVGTNGAAITAYAAVSFTDYGKNYIRNNGAMNPATAASGTSLNGGGSAFPTYGTGNTLFVQAGYLLPKNILGEKGGQLQPYADITFSQYDRLKDNVLIWDAGVNWLIDGHRSKVSVNYQNRPVFSNTDFTESTRKSMVIVQLQIAI